MLNGVADLADVAPETVAQYQSELMDSASGLARSSSNRMLAAVRGLHAFALKERWTSIDSCSLLVASRSPARLPKALSVTDTIKVVEILSKSETSVDMRDYAVVEFLYSTGARISEVVGLKLDDLDLQNGSVRLFGKGNKYRVVPIGSTAVAALERYLVRARPSFVRNTTAVVFLNRKGEALGRQSAFNAVSRCAELAHIKQPVSPHTLRHCFATHLLEGGADVRVVQELLGHASVTTTQIYTLVTQQRLREVYSMAHPRSRN